MFVSWWWWFVFTAIKGLFYFWIYFGEYFQFWRILIKHWGKNMQTQIKKTTLESESNQTGWQTIKRHELFHSAEWLNPFFLIEAISLPLNHRITFTFKHSVPNLDAGHYQGGATTLGKITPPRTDSSHRNWVLLLKNKSSSLFTSIPLRAQLAGSPLLLRCCREEVGGDLQSGDENV